MIQIQAGNEEAGGRLDRMLRKRLSLMSLSDIYSLIRKGGVKVNGKKVPQNYRIQENDAISINVNPAELTPKQRTSESNLKNLANTDFFKRNFKVLYEDPHILACDKPPGLVVHSGTGHVSNDNLIDLASSYLLTKGELKEGDEPVLVHRLDRDTSGVILIAKNKMVVRKIHELFRTRDLTKEYIAVCHGKPPQFEGEVNVGMVRTHGLDTGTKMKVDEEGAASKSKYRVAAFENNLSKLEILLETGKTHQIRVHMAHLGCPIVGDDRYGNKDLDSILFKTKKIPSRLYLHAHKVSLQHPITSKKLTIVAPKPAEFQKVMS